MRDILITVIVLGSIPYIMRRPFIGLLMWVWISMMNPHRLAYGFANDMPFAMIIGVCALTSFMVHFNKLQKFPVNALTLAMVTWALWINISPMFSFHPESEAVGWSRAIKIQIMVLFALFVVSDRKELEQLLMVLVLSMAFYGAKGGLFTIASGGSHRVWGPEGSFVADNNHLAVALIMCAPLLRYLQIVATNKWVARGLLATMILCIVAALGSHSRGALLGLSAMGMFLWLKGSNKFVTGVLIAIAVPTIFAVMPDHWTERMSTIKTYEQDGSAMGRINAWWMTFNLAVDRFPIGGGFAIYEPDLFQKYAPDPEVPRAAHSIYFQCLGEQGFGGLFIFLSIFLLAWMCGSEVIRLARQREEELRWARDMAAMCQVSLIGFLVGGAFLSLTYFDLPFYVVAILVLLREVVRRELAHSAAPAAMPGAVDAVSANRAQPSLRAPPRRMGPRS